MLDFNSAFTKLQSVQQTHLLDHWSQLADDEKQYLLMQIAQLDINLFRMQQEILKNPPKPSPTSFEPFVNYKEIGSDRHIAIGREAIARGKMGCLIVAGGQGTRLKLNGPKGLYPISNIRKKSLFQLFAEKIVAAGRQVNHTLSTAIMSSPLNHAMTKTYFDAHAQFGLKNKQLDIFSQNMLPFLDENGNLFLEKKGTIAFGPDGNGSALHNFWNQGIGPKWKEMGIEYVNFVLIDNPLADPFDAELLGFHISNNNTITIKCTSKLSPDEKVGVLVQREGKVNVIEYSEMPESERNALNQKGTLKHSCANISLFCINLAFIEELCKKHTPLPLHPAFKSAPSLTNKENKAWKFEYFIFDILPLADKVEALIYPREKCFAPLKNISGMDSPATVQLALLHQDRDTYEKLFGKKPPAGVFELAQDFYYPTDLLLDIWKNKIPFNDPYIGSI